MSNFKTLLGNRVYLEIPKKEESKIVVDDNTKEALKREMLKKYSRLKIFAIGEGVTNPNLRIGDEVLVEPESLARKAVMVDLSDDVQVALISYFDIIHIW